MSIKTGHYAPIPATAAAGALAAAAQLHARTNPNPFAWENGVVRCASRWNGVDRIGLGRGLQKAIKLREKSDLEASA